VRLRAITILILALDSLFRKSQYDFFAKPVKDTKYAISWV